jgi:hypothetical protein
MISGDDDKHMKIQTGFSCKNTAKQGFAGLKMLCILSNPDSLRSSGIIKH